MGCVPILRYSTAQFCWTILEHISENGSRKAVTREAQGTRGMVGNK